MSKRSTPNPAPSTATTFTGQRQTFEYGEPLPYTHALDAVQALVDLMPEGSDPQRWACNPTVLRALERRSASKAELRKARAELRRRLLNPKTHRSV